MSDNIGKTFRVLDTANQGVSTAANFKGNPFRVDMFNSYSFWWYLTSGTPTGTISIEITSYRDVKTDGYSYGSALDPIPSTASTFFPSNAWVDLSLIKLVGPANAYAAVGPTSGSPASGIINVIDIPGQFARVSWTGSGAGNLIVVAKGRKVRNF